MKDVQYQGLVPVRATLVPARAAYLVREGSRSGLRRAVQEASTRWAGATELILPIPEDGKIEDWVKAVVPASGVDGLVSVDLSEAEAEEAASVLGLPWVPIADIDRSGPVRLTCHPSWLEPPAYPTSWVIASASDQLWQAVVAGELSSEHLDLMDAHDLPLSKPINRDGIGRAQLREHTWMDRTEISLNEIYASPAPMSTPTILWITTSDNLNDCWEFWNVRALRPRTFAKMPIFMLPYEDVLHWEAFGEQLLATLDRRNEFSPDVIITSTSVGSPDLHELAKELGLLRAESSDVNLFGAYPLTTERRRAPFTYSIKKGVAQFVTFDRRYGVGTQVDTHFFRGRETSIKFDSPVSFKAEGGTLLVRLESPMFDGLPRRDAVASLIAPEATWHDDSIQVGAYARQQFRLDIKVPGLADALHAILSMKARSYALSNKGRLADAFRKREEETRALLEPNLYETIRGLTTPRSKTLVNELSRILGAGQVTGQIMDLAQSWAVQGKRVYRGTSNIHGISKPAAAVALERLCTLSWAERGLEVQCRTCRTSSFLELSSVPTRNGAECPACGDSQQYTASDGGPTVLYRLDGLVDHCSDQGILPHLLAIAALTGRQPQSWFMPGVDFSFDGSSTNEADIVGLYGGRLTIGEVKTSASEFTERQVAKDIEVARKVGADIYVMAAPESIGSETRNLAEALCRQEKLELIVLDQNDLRPPAPLGHYPLAQATPRLIDV